MNTAYFAGSYFYKHQIAACAAEYRAAGGVVTSRWLSEPHSPSTQLQEISNDLLVTYARQDFEDIDSASVFVLFAIPLSEPPQPRAGRHVECGYAMAKEKPILVVGHEGVIRENIFQFFPSVYHAASWADALTLLQTRIL
jgi:nucleoside 2-deoxyribosyltransferase